MMSYTRRRLLSLVALCAFEACGSDTTGPSNQPPAHLDAVADLARTAAVGTAVPGGIVVKVTDAGGRPVQGATVALAVTLGNGSTNPRLATSDPKGQATAAWTLGTIVGPNEVTATVSGVGTTVKFSATGTAGPVTAISISPQSARLLPAADTTRITAQSLDAFGNVATPKPTLTPRDPSLISIDAAGLVRALRRGARDLRRRRGRVQDRQHSRHGARCRPIDLHWRREPARARGRAGDHERVGCGLVRARHDRRGGVRDRSVLRFGSSERDDAGGSPRSGSSTAVDSRGDDFQLARFAQCRARTCARRFVRIRSP